MIIRILEATANIPKGYLFEVAELHVGSVIEQEYRGSNYRIAIDRIRHIEGDRYQISNSNLVAIVEVVNG